MQLVSIVLSSMIAWVPPAEHRHLEPPAVTERRYEEIAEVIASVVAEAQGERILGSAELEALLLASVAGAESHYAARVEDCKGRHAAYSLWQIEGHRKEACAGRRAASKLALAMIRESFRVCAALPFLDRLAFYTDGRCERQWWRSRSRVTRAVDVWRARAESHALREPATPSAPLGFTRMLHATLGSTRERSARLVSTRPAKRRAPIARRGAAGTAWNDG